MLQIIELIDWPIRKADVEHSSSTSVEIVPHGDKGAFIAEPVLSGRPNDMDTNCEPTLSESHWRTIVSVVLIDEKPHDGADNS